MTIDERLEALIARHEALTARHEALTLTVELISHDVRELGPLVRSMAEGINGLTAIVRSHEQRISRLEGQ